MVFYGAIVMSGCSSATRTCTLIGCQDGFSASVRSADGSFPSGMHRIEIMTTGVVIACAFTFPLEVLPTGGLVQPTCPAGVNVNILSVAGPDQVVESIVLPGTPPQVHVWQYVDDVTILDAAAAPSYHTVQPNGPECGPVCRQASASWTLQ
jgi:hypothetical protein